LRALEIGDRPRFPGGLPSNSTGWGETVVCPEWHLLNNKTYVITESYIIINDCGIRYIFSVATGNAVLLQNRYSRDSRPWAC